MLLCFSKTESPTVMACVYVNLGFFLVRAALRCVEILAYKYRPEAIETSVTYYMTYYMLSM
ncbi:MAG: hypothetical protein P4M11_12380 [Candidatus Pacebacteria bacterium]|nr:hypothetical protein [Candidatus Paceibacterota bacterium]